ncbi:tonsoku-like protein [Ambystoma mexicanum]|uniref:tonsoku-like protein n=1 Tax=Ambystoma mexicanum TaxID=8296 RepID=UPI0037E8BC41
MSGLAKDIRQLEKAKIKAQKARNLQEEATVCNQLGEILAKNGQFREAIEEHRQELQICEGVHDVIGSAVANRKIGECLAELGNYEAALKHQRRHLELARSVSNDIEEQRAWATIGRTYLYIYEANQSSESLLQAQTAFQKSLTIVDERLEGQVASRELNEMRARLFLNLGFLYDSMKDPAKCNYYIRKSVFISEQTHLYEDLYRANYNLGTIHFRNGEHSKAIRCWEAAKECAKKMKEKVMESECFSNIGQVLLSLGDFVAAKRSLKKAYRLGLQPAEREGVRRNLKYAIKGCHLEERLADLSEEDQQGALSLNEQLGDLFCKVQCYRKAIEHYKVQLRCAEALKKPERELAVIHVSLAFTFGDLKDYSQALKHYQAELELRRGNPLEECKTWLSMALVKEDSGQGYDEVESCFTNALRCAELAGKPKLQRRVLKQLHTLQTKMGSPKAHSTLDRLQEFCLQQGWSSEGESGDSSEEEELESSEPVEESDLELSESDEDEDLEGYDKAVSGRRKVSQWNRRNEKGETTLHRACIEGNLKQVQYVVEKGHPMNPRDYCGWTPLHEACNHGHLEIVQFLLEHGANINDPGGPLCEGITPLHDALASGNFEVAQLLIQKGASATQRNAKGETPLGSLQEWTKMYGKHLDPETTQRRKETERLLKEAASGRFHQVAEPPSHFQDSELFDAETSQRLTPPLPRAMPVDCHPAEPETRRPRHDSGEPRKKSFRCLRTPVSNSKNFASRHHSDSEEELGSDCPLSASSGREHSLEDEWGPEEHQDGYMTPLRPVKKRARLMDLKSSADTGWTHDPNQLNIQENRANFASSSNSHLELSGHQDVDIELPSGGRTAYQNTIRSLGSAKSMRLTETLTDTPTLALDPRDRLALIPADQYISDDWLEDDLGRSHPRKRSRCDPLSRLEEMAETGTDSDDSDTFPPRERAALQRPASRPLSLGKKRSRQTRLTQIVDRTVVGRTKGGSWRDSERENTSIPRATDRIRQTPALTSTRVTDVGIMQSQAVTSLEGNRMEINVVHPVTAINPAAPPPVRVRVRVLENIFLIPVPHSGSETRPVSWLEEQASKRYYQTCGLLPRLTLKKEGALLASQDLILHVLQSNEEVLAEVHSWDLPPLKDRYKKACQSLDVAEHRLVIKILEQQENSPSFKLCNLSLRRRNLTPLLRALKLQSSIRQLHLSGNCIDDLVVEELLATVATMPNLTLLDLSSNQMTHEGLAKLCPATGLFSEDPFKNLEELDLSINPLGDGCSQSLASLVRCCPVLSTLRLQACGLTAKFLQHYRLLLADALKGAVHLKTLVLSHNALGSTGVELILKSLPHHTLSCLEVGATATSPRDNPLMDPVVRYLSQEGCALTHLGLSGNHLTEEAMRDLARGLLLCPSLVSLDLSGNPGIGLLGLELLLSAVRERNSGLKYLNLAGCSIRGPLNSSTLDGISSDLRELQLCTSHLSKKDKESLMKAWPCGPGVVARQQKLFYKCL